MAHDLRVGLAQVPLEMEQPVFLEAPPILERRTEPLSDRDRLPLPVLLDDGHGRPVVYRAHVQADQIPVHASTENKGSISSVKAAWMSANRKTESIASVNEQKYSDSYTGAGIRRRSRAKKSSVIRGHSAAVTFTRA